MTNNEAELRAEITTITIDEFGVSNLEAVDKLMQLISDHTRKAIEAELEQLLCPIGCHYGDNCKVEHTRLRKSYIKDRLAALKQPTVEEE